MSDPAGEIFVSHEAGSKTIIVWTIWLVMEEGQLFWKKVLIFFLYCCIIAIIQ